MTGCNNGQIDSGWSDDVVVIDGNDREWRNNQFIPNKEKVALGIMNDADNLYISFRTADQATILRALIMGFTVWIDPRGRNSQVFGIKYPVGSGPGEMRGMKRGASDSYEERDQQIEFLLQNQNIVDIYGSDDFLVRRLPVSNESGIIVKPGYIQGQFIYELQIPLAVIEEQTGSVRIEPGATVGVGFLAGEIDREVMREQGNGDMSDAGGGKGGGRGGGRGGGMDGGMGGGRGGGGKGGPSGGGAQASSREQPKSMKLWFRVKLAIRP
ncbi:MAG: hypothetical protein ABIA75_14850 [Candidatus Neomarinimicrobiota bacterium]